VNDSAGSYLDYRCWEINTVFEQMFDLKSKGVQGKALADLFPQWDGILSGYLERLAIDKDAERLQIFDSDRDRYFLVSGVLLKSEWVALFFAKANNNDGAATLNHSQNQEQRRLKLADIFFNNTREAILITDANQKILTVNPAYTELSGYQPDEVIGKTPTIHQSNRHDASYYQSLWQSIQQKGHWQGEFWNRRKNGELYPAWENIAAVKNEQGEVTHYVAVIADISPLKQAEAKLTDLAHYDSLTGLANRLLFTAQMEQAVGRAKRHQKKLALLFIDLDHFKLINDTYGHDAGDDLLKEVAKRLRQNVREEDCVGRLSGDEFMVLLENVTHAKDATALASKLIEAIGKPCRLDKKEVTISASIGISIYPDDAGDVAGLMKTADTAMYRAKHRGRHTIELFRADLTIPTVDE
jgi:diguanylate cyclase (GGDEF)-like protein/PAS domain S-box-containing protein